MTVDAGLTRVRTGRACDAVIAQLEERILDGTWPLHSRIPTEPELTTALGVGRNTVREAVRALEHAGLLEPRRGDGTYVRATSALGAAVYRRARQTDMLHVLEVRASLERSAAEAAARNRSAADAERVTEAARVRRAACDVGDTEAFVAADLAFHRAVVAATGNPVLADLYDGLTEAVERSVTEIDRLYGDRADFPGHDELAAAILAGDPRAALAAANTYLDVARTIVERQP